MPIGKSPYFVKILGQVLGLAGLGIALSACGIVRKSDTCNLKADGLRIAGFNGENLSDKQLSIVFLKGPADSTEAIGSFLSGLTIPATFFIKGSEVLGHEETLGRLVDQGHRLASGGYSFTALKAAEDPVVEVRALDKLISRFATGYQYWLYGEPGSLDARALKQLKNAGLGKYIGPIHSDTVGAAFVDDERCWERGLSVSVCSQGYFDELVRIGHGLVPFHSEDERSLELIKDLVPQLVAFGFTFVKLDQVPDLRFALKAAGGIPDAGKAGEVCNDYE